MFSVCCICMLCSILPSFSKADFRIDAYYSLTDCEASTGLLCNQTIGRPSDPTDQCAIFDGSEFIKIVNTLPGCILYALIADEAMEYCGYLGKFPPTVNQCYGTEGWRFYEMKCSTRADNETNPAADSNSTDPAQASNADDVSNPSEDPDGTDPASAPAPQAQLDMANKMALGVGLGIGLPKILVTVFFGIRMWYQRSYSISLVLPRLRGV